jgi:septal ring factor EnvC (AmiA/AmiB activator)
MNNREEDKLFHSAIPKIKKKHVVQGAWGSGVSVAGILMFMQMGWIPPLTAMDMEKHEVKADKKMDALKKDYEKEVTEIKEHIKSLEKNSNDQREKIHIIQVDTARIQSDVQHIKETTIEIKQLIHGLNP